MINEFFAVTKTSIYKVVHDEKTGKVTLEKVYLKGQSLVPNGFKTDPMDEILIIESIYWDNGYWHTSHIKGLFRTFDEAKMFIESEEGHLMWLSANNKTSEVLKEIGNNHPTIKIIRAPGNLLE